MGFQKGNKIWTGRKHSKATLAKMRAVKRTPEQKEKIAESRRGKKTSEDLKLKLSLGSPHLGKKGAAHPAWKGGFTPENIKIRQSKESALWKKAVFERDDFTCQKTGVRGGKLEAHHIRNFSEHKELRFAIDNGVTLCKEAHKEFHKIYGRKNNTPEQLVEFLNK